MVEEKEIRKERFTAGGEAAEEITRGSSGQVDVLTFSRRKNASSGVEAKERKIHMNVDQCSCIGTPSLSFLTEETGPSIYWEESP